MEGSGRNLAQGTIQVRGSRGREEFQLGHQSDGRDLNPGPRNTERE